MALNGPDYIDLNDNQCDELLFGDDKPDTDEEVEVANDFGTETETEKADADPDFGYLQFFHFGHLQFSFFCIISF